MKRHYIKISKKFVKKVVEFLDIIKKTIEGLTLTERLALLSVIIAACTLLVSILQLVM